VGTANVELENTGVDIPKVFGPNSPEEQQLAQDPDSFKDAETADYVGVAVHCAQNSALRARGVTALGECYKQLNSSVGGFGTATLQAATKAIESTSRGDRIYRTTDKILQGLDIVRDRLAEQIKGELEAAAFHNTPIPPAQVHVQTDACDLITGHAAQLARHVS
jgi:hypothetical protein